MPVDYTIAAFITPMMVRLSVVYTNSVLRHSPHRMMMRFLLNGWAMSNSTNMAFAAFNVSNNMY